MSKGRWEIVSGLGEKVAEIEVGKKRGKVVDGLVKLFTKG